MKPLHIFMAATLVTEATEARSQVSSGHVVRYDLVDGDLATTLKEIARRASVSVLYAPETVAGRRSSAVRGRLSPTEAINAALAGTGLRLELLPDGTLLVEPQPTGVAPAVPEILVVGHRTQNADIRRTENDIQPYKVSTREEIRASQANTVSEYLRTREPSNSEIRLPSQNGAFEYGAARSEVDLHGLGAEQTLVLVDGMRMPRAPGNLNAGKFLQPDVNPLDPGAIERIETLTATAGGIYGPDAVGGVVNIILRRDYRGLELTGTSGLSSRGDAAFRRFDLNAGFTPDGGRTNIMINGSYSLSDPLTQGDRDYTVRFNQTAIASDPLAYLKRRNSSDAIVITSFDGSPLTLKAANGGAALGSSYTYLPLGVAGTGSTLTTLLANSGSIPAGLAPDVGGTGADLLGRQRTASLLANIRHEFSSSVEAFVDLIALWNEGSTTFLYPNSNSALVSATAPGNPFNQSLYVTFPQVGYGGTLQTSLDTTRLSAGLILRVSPTWKIEASGAYGTAKQYSHQSLIQPSYSASSALLRAGATTYGPALNPFGDFAAFSQALLNYQQTSLIGARLESRLTDVTVRAAGELFDLPGGPVTLSLLGEYRRDVAPTVIEHLEQSSLSLTAGLWPRMSQATISGYGELRAPVVPRSGGFSPIRGLELQFAARVDTVKTYVGSGAYLSAASAEARQTAPVFTVGFKAYPSDRLMLRASAATAIVPTRPIDMATYTLKSPYISYPDPLRGGTPSGITYSVTELFYGSARLKPERARTLSAGIVINPDSKRGLRASLDFTHIDMWDEVTNNYSGQPLFFIENEALYPDRITRGPLTAADIALGYTGGPILQIDTTYLNLSKTWMNAVDLNVDYRAGLGSLGKIRLYGAATWQPLLRRKAAPAIAAVNYVGYFDGPLEWHANGGFDWQYHRLDVNVNGQYYSGYRDVNAADAAQGAVSPKIAGQFYVDMTARYRISLDEGRPNGSELSLTLGIQNLFDHSPPLIDYQGNYSYYGDPRRRRFTFGASVNF